MTVNLLSSEKEFEDYLIYYLPKRNLKTFVLMLLRAFYMVKCFRTVCEEHTT